MSKCMATDKKLFKDFCMFSRYQLKSKDIDPVYPVLEDFYRINKFKGESSHWFTLLYVTFYHLGSAQKAFDQYPKPSKINPRDWRSYPTGVERRGFRGNDLAALHINAVVKKLESGKITSWISNCVVEDKPQLSWRKIRQEFQTLPYAGPWSSYKWADLLKNVHHWNITANDIGVGGNSETAGPIPGMVLLTGLNWKECAMNTKVQRELLSKCRDEGVNFGGLDQLETCLCDFNSMIKGSYYCRHDIDDMISKLPEDKIWWKARKNVFNHRLLGELNGWDGIQKKLNGHYVSTGKVYCPYD